MELEIKGEEAKANITAKKAQEVLFYAQAVNQLAQADKAVADPHLQWLSQQLLVWQKQFDAAQVPGDSETGRAGGMAPGSPQPPALPHPTMPAQPQLPNSGPSINPHNPAAALPAVQ
jgi:hypothetical protein